MFVDQSLCYCSTSYVPLENGLGIKISKKILQPNHAPYVKYKLDYYEVVYCFYLYKQLQ